MAKTTEKRFFTLEPCASAKAYEIKFEEGIDLKKAEAALAGTDEILASNKVMLMANMDGNSVTIYASGRALIKHVTKEKAEELGRRIAEAL